MSVYRIPLLIWSGDKRIWHGFSHHCVSNQSNSEQKHQKHQQVTQKDQPNSGMIERPDSEKADRRSTNQKSERLRFDTIQRKVMGK